MSGQHTRPGDRSGRPLRIGVHAGARLDGGMARYALELVRGLALRDDVHLVPVATRTVLDSLADLDLPDSICLPDGQLRETSALRFGVGHRLAGRIDVFHGTRHLLPRRCPAPAVITVHDVLLLDDRRAYDAPKRWLLPGPFRHSTCEADAVVCVSAITRDRLLRHLPAVGGRTEVVPTGVASGVLSADPRPMTAPGRFALYVGDLSPRKNVRFLLDLWPTVWERHGIELLLAGPDGWQSQDLRDRLERGVAGVRRLGFVSDENLRWLYDNAVVVVNPSLYEGTGLPVLEALACGAPVVANTEPALMETGGGNVRHVPVGDPAAWLLAIEDVLDEPRPAPARPPGGHGWLDAMVDIYHRVTAWPTSEGSP